MRRVAVILGVLLALMAAAPSALAERRLALVVGNDLYPNLPADRQLRNAVHDARAMAATLQALGFEIFGGAQAGRHGENLGRNDFIDRLGDLQAKVEPGDIVFVFFAGHGISIKGANILLPSDVPAPRGLGAAEEDRYVQRGIAEGDIIEQLTKLKAKAVIIALDACRDNPVASGGRTLGGARGFVQARVEASGAAFFFSIYSAGYGQHALDRLGPSDTVSNSVFTRVFVENLRRPGLHIQDIASRTRQAVRKMTQEAMGYDQFLAYMDQLPDPVYLAGLPANAVLTRAAQDKQLLDDVASQLSKSAAGSTGSALPLGPEQLRSVLAEAAASRAPAKRAALQMIADGGVEEGARALEAHARDETLVAAALDAAAREQKAGAAQNWREAGAIWRFKSVGRAIDNYEKAHQLEPDDFWTNVELARLYRSAGRLADAHAAARRLLTARAAERPADLAYQRERSVAHEDYGEVLVGLGNLAEALKSFRDGLAIRERLAKAEPGRATWQHDLSLSYEKVGDVLRAQGNLTEALTSYRGGLAIRERLAKAEPNDVGSKRDLSVMNERLGDVYLAQGRLGAALEQYRASLDRMAPLRDRDPSNADLQRFASVTLNKVGDVRNAQGNLAEALTSYRASLAIAERLAKSDPANAGWQRDLSVSYNKVGDALRAQGNLTEALKYFRDDLAIAERLAGADPSNAGWQRDLTVSYNKVGGVLAAQGNPAEALKFFRDGLVIREHLTKADPSNAGWQRDLSVSYNAIGALLMKQGQHGEALANFRADLVIAQRLAAIDPGNSDWQRDLVISYEKVGDAQKAQGNLAEALTSYRDSLVIAERLVSRDASHSGWQRQLSVTYSKIGDLLMRQGRHGEALASYQADLAIAQRLAALDPGNSGWQRDLGISYQQIVTVLRKLKDRNELTGEQAERLIEVEAQAAKLREAQK